MQNQQTIQMDYIKRKRAKSVVLSLSDEKTGVFTLELFNYDPETGERIKSNVVSISMEQAQKNLEAARKNVELLEELYSDMRYWLEEKEVQDRPITRNGVRERG